MSIEGCLRIARAPQQTIVDGVVSSNWARASRGRGGAHSDFACPFIGKLYGKPHSSYMVILCKRAGVPRARLSVRECNIFITYVCMDMRCAPERCNGQAPAVHMLAEIGVNRVYYSNIIVSARVYTILQTRYKVSAWISAVHTRRLEIYARLCRPCVCYMPVCVILLLQLPCDHFPSIPDGRAHFPPQWNCHFMREYMCANWTS